MSQEQIEYINKKIEKVTDLLESVYVKDIKDIILQENDDLDITVPRVIFKNKPDQSFCIMFITKDTWADIKRKMNKLIESDGLCVVCFEKEIHPETNPCKNKECDCKFKKDIPEKDSMYCFDCCEMLCFNCFETIRSCYCPVCRKHIGVGFRHYFEIE